MFIIKFVDLFILNNFESYTFFVSYVVWLKNGIRLLIIVQVLKYYDFSDLDRLRNFASKIWRDF